MPEQLLNVLKLCLLVLLYLFFLRVARAVWVEVNGPRLRSSRARQPAVAAVPAAAGPPAAGTRGTSSRRKAGRAAKGKGGATGGRVHGQPALVVLAPPEEAGRRYDLHDELTVGRAAGCQITLDDTYVSQLHARVFFREGSVFVEDLGSTNGTYLNRRKVAGPLMLKPGDQVQVGSTVLELAA